MCQAGGALVCCEPSSRSGTSCLGRALAVTGPRARRDGPEAAPVAARIEAHDTPRVVELSIFTRYVLRSHIVPAAAGLAIFYFVLSMDFIVDYLDLFIARGVPGLAVLEAFGLSLAWMTLLAVPMAVMVAVLTAFGRLAQDNEITAAKANGVPILSLIAPVLIASALDRGCGLFYFGNHALPGANHRLKTLLVSIHRMRPLATIQPGVLTELPGGYTIIVDRIDPRTSEIFRVRIYRLESGEPVQTVVAARGRVVSAADSDILTIELDDGEIHNIDREDPTRYNRLVFERHSIHVESGSAELIRAEDTKRGDRELSLAEIRTRIAAHDADLAGARRRAASALDKHLTSLLDAADGDRPAGSPAAIERDRTQAMHAAEVALRAMEAEMTKARKLRVEYHKKLSIPVACVVFVLLGAPIGIRTRRGGVGIGAGIGMLFFLIYYLFLIGGEQLGDRGFVSPFWAMWAPNVLFGGLGLFLTSRRRARVAGLEVEARVTILDTYVLRRTIIPLAFVFAAFVSIFVLVDLFDHAHTFIDNDVPIRVVLAYYAHYMPFVVVLTAPVAMLLATLLAVGRFTRSNELTAMKGSGVSLYRILLPVLLLAAALSAASLVVAETVVPLATQTQARHPGHSHQEAPTAERPLGRDLHASGRDDAPREALRHEEQHARGGHGPELRPRPQAQHARSMPRPGRGRAVTGFSTTAACARSPRRRSPRRVFESFELPYADPTPQELSTRLLKPEELGYADLRAHIARLRASGTDPGDLPVQLALKLSFPFVVLIMTLLGAPIAAGARRGGFALAFTGALAISFLYYGVLQVGSVLGRQGMLPPTLSAWIANILFAGHRHLDPRKDPQMTPARARRARAARTDTAIAPTDRRRGVRSGPDLPRGKVLDLLRGQSIDRHPHGRQFERGHGRVDLRRHAVHAGREPRGTLREVLAAQRLVGEAHVHHGGRMPFGARQVDEAALAEQVHALSTAQHERLDRRPGREHVRRHGAQGVLVDLDVEVPRVRHHGSVLHGREVTRR